MVDEADESEPGNPDSDEMYEPQVFHGRNGDAGNGTTQTLLAGKGSGWSVQDGPLLVEIEPSGDGQLDAANARLLQALIEQEAAERKVNAAQKAVDRAQAAWEKKQKPAPANRRRAPKKTRPSMGGVGLKLTRFGEHPEA